MQQKHHDHFSKFANAEQQVDRLCELNVIEQVMHTAQTTIVRDAWSRDHALSIHGLVYRLTDGLIRDLGVSLTGPAELGERYEEAIRRLGIT